MDEKRCFGLHFMEHERRQAAVLRNVSCQIATLELHRI